MRIRPAAHTACAVLLTAVAACGTPQSAPAPSSSATGTQPSTPGPSAPASSGPAAPTSPGTPAAPTGSAAGTGKPDVGHGTATATGTPGPLEPTLLGEGDVPGFQVTSKGDLEQAAAQAATAAQAASAMSFQPPQCDALVKGLIAHAAGIYQAMSVGAAQGFSSSTGVQLAEAVVLAPDAAPYIVEASGVAGCETVTATTGAATATLSIEPLSLGIGDSSSGAFITQQISVAGTVVTTVTGNVSVVRNGGVVALSITGPSEDPGQLRDLLVSTAKKAYPKAEPAFQ